MPQALGSVLAKAMTQALGRFDAGDINTVVGAVSGGLGIRDRFSSFDHKSVATDISLGTALPWGIFNFARYR